MPIAKVADPYEMTDTMLVPLSHLGLAPKDVERTCTLTWNCDADPLGPNPHPNDVGYKIIAERRSPRKCLRSLEGCRGYSTIESVTSMLPRVAFE
jgi:hypothetical protein